MRVSMKSAVMIKSFTNGIALHLREDAQWEDILKETADKFSKSRAFFQDASVALSFEGRALTGEEELALTDVITQNSDLQILCICSKEESTERMLLHALDRLNLSKSAGALPPDMPICQLHNGNVSNGMVLDSRENILVLGDVYPGCAVVSEKSIFVLGGLYGEAQAGHTGESGHFVFALDLAPEKLRVDGIRARGTEKSRWSILNKQAPKAAVLKKGVVTMVPVSKGTWIDLLT